MQYTTFSRAETVIIGEINVKNKIFIKNLKYVLARNVSNIFADYILYTLLNTFF